MIFFNLTLSSLYCLTLSSCLLEIAMSKNHHHGNLRQTLIEAGLTLLRQSGAAGLSIRKVAALAGVSHAAPAHHFANLMDLRTAVLAAGHHAFAASMQGEIDLLDRPDPRQRILAALRGYVAFAADNPALFQMMFGGASRNEDDPDLCVATDASYGVLRDICAPIHPGPGGAEANELMVWSLVHGFASLALTDTSGELDIRDTSLLDLILPPLKFSTST